MDRRLEFLKLDATTHSTPDGDWTQPSHFNEEFTIHADQNIPFPSSLVWGLPSYLFLVGSLHISVLVNLVMFEPLAASVLNTFLHSARPIATHRAPSLSMAAVSSFPADFFTPTPRQHKGKERASPDLPFSSDEFGTVSSPLGLDYLSYSSQRASTPCRSVEHPIPCRSRVRRSHCHRLKPLPSQQTCLLRPDSSHRRHSSHSPALSPSLIGPSRLVASSAVPLSLQPGITDNFDQNHPIHVIRHVAKDEDLSFDMDEAWAAYQRFRAEEIPGNSLTKDLLRFSSVMLTSAQSMSPNEWRQWGTRIRPLLIELEPYLHNPEPSPGRRLVWNCLMVRANALTGNFRDALEHLHATKRRATHSEQDLTLIDTFRTIILTMDHYVGPSAALGTIIEEWRRMGPYLHYQSRIQYSPLVRSRRVAFRELAHTVISSLSSPADEFVKFAHQWTDDQRKTAGEFLIETLSRDSTRSDDVFSVMREMYTLDAIPSAYHRMVTIRALIKAEKFSLGTQLFLSFENEFSESHPVETQSCGLYVYARQGDVERTKSFFQKLSSSCNYNEGDIATMIYAHALHGHCRDAEELFYHYCIGHGDSATIVFPPNVYHWTAVLVAFAKARDPEGLDIWLQEMIAAGVEPDSHVYSILAECLVRDDKLQDLLALLDQMKLAGFRPGCAAYTSILTLLGRRGDPEAADAIFKRAISEGVKPDRHMLTTLMNVHVEAGSWRGVILAFDYIKDMKSHFNIEVWNTLLKAYILVGAPFKVITTLWAKLDEVGMEPDNRSFVLMIQAACDAGRLRTAVSLFEEMERMSTSRLPSDSAYALTTIMAGYLRMKDKARARTIFETMKQKNIVPTSVTYGFILKAYGYQRSTAGASLAEGFVTSLLKEPEARSGWLHAEGGRAKALEHVFRPLMSSWRRKRRPAQVERVYQKMLSFGGRPTLGSLTLLLDVFRRKGNVQAVLGLWPQIVQFGIKHTEALDPLFAQGAGLRPPEGRRNSDILCIPFSIYIDALSSAGHHAEIAKAWGDLQSQGFTLDSHNWNHLAAALLRAGEPERAFEILERVILKNRRYTMTPSPRNPEPQSPLLSELPKDCVEMRDLPLDESPLHNLRNRSTKAGIIARRLRPWMEDFSRNDFVHPLHVLHTISPAWDIWRPHNITLYLLSRSLSRLKSGNLIQPIQPGRNKQVASFSIQVVDVEQLQERNAASRGILHRIMENYPKAVSAVLMWAKSNNKRPCNKHHAGTRSHSRFRHRHRTSIGDK